MKPVLGRFKLTYLYQAQYSLKVSLHRIMVFCLQKRAAASTAPPPCGQNIEGLPAASFISSPYNLRRNSGNDDEASDESGRILSLTTQKATTFSRSFSAGGKRLLAGSVCRSASRARSSSALFLFRAARAFGAADVLRELLSAVRADDVSDNFQRQLFGSRKVEAALSAVQFLL